jgi:FtsH-binding integral membrane protein
MTADIVALLYRGLAWGLPLANNGGNGTQFLTALQTGMQGLAIPLGVIGLLFIGLAFVLTPVARNWSSEAQNSIRYVFAGVMILTFAPAIIAFVTGLFNSGQN